MSYPYYEPEQPPGVAVRQADGTWRAAGTAEQPLHVKAADGWVTFAGGTGAPLKQRQADGSWATVATQGVPDDGYYPPPGGGLFTQDMRLLAVVFGNPPAGDATFGTSAPGPEQTFTARLSPNVRLVTRVTDYEPDFWFFQADLDPGASLTAALQGGDTATAISITGGRISFPGGSSVAYDPTQMRVLLVQFLGSRIVWSTSPTGLRYSGNNSFTVRSDTPNTLTRAVKAVLETGPAGGVALSYMNLRSGMYL